MLHENNIIFQDISLHHCDTRFGYYGLFATLLLRAAFIQDNVNTTITSFKQSLKYSVANPASSAKLAEYIRNLDFPDSDIFTLEEIRFLIQISQPCSPLTKQQIESDRRELKREMRQHGRILKSHAIILLKALSFWELRYTDKYDEWMVMVNAAHDELFRRLSKAPANDVDIVDEGYESC